MKTAWWSCATARAGGRSAAGAGAHGSAGGAIPARVYRNSVTDPINKNVPAETFPADVRRADGVPGLAGRAPGCGLGDSTSCTRWRFGPLRDDPFAYLGRGDTAPLQRRHGSDDYDARSTSTKTHPVSECTSSSTLPVLATLAQPGPSRWPAWTSSPSRIKTNSGRSCV